MRYAEIRNANGSHVIDDQYQNYRLDWVPNVKVQRCLTGMHVEKNEAGERVCTFPYYDYANGKSYAWPQGGNYPNPWCAKTTPNKDKGLFSDSLPCISIAHGACGQQESSTDTRDLVSNLCLCGKNPS